MNMSPHDSPTGPVLKVAELAKGVTRSIRVEPGAEAMAQIAEDLGLLGLRKLRFEGQLSPLGKRDWRLTGHLGATVVQPCVVTLAPVTTRIEEDVARNWVANFETPEADELEIPETVDDEPLGSEIDIGTVIAEALALALPAWPRAEGAEVGEAVFTEPGKQAMRDEDTRPFAGLAALRGKLSDDAGED
jgi:uncharacterized metal-binding protein YceD (DUF177 family)